MTTAEQPMILVVDDHPVAARALAMLLDRVGCRTRVATNGHTALSICDSLQPDFVLLDLRMPEIDGFDVARRLRQNGHLESAQLVAITADGDEETRDRALAAGFDEFLRNPVRLETLREVLRV